MAAENHENQASILESAVMFPGFEALLTKTKHSILDSGKEKREHENNEHFTEITKICLTILIIFISFVLRCYKYYRFLILCSNSEEF